MICVESGGYFVDPTIQLNGEQTVPTNKDGDMRFLKMMEEYF